jgi:hypothetical protein
VQFAHLEGLGQVVVGAEFQADDAVDRFARSGQHHQAHAGVRLAQEARQRQPVLAGHVDVEDGQLRRTLGDQPARRGGVFRLPHHEAVAAEVLGQQRAQLRFVVDDHHLGLDVGGAHVADSGGKG